MPAHIQHLYSSIGKSITQFIFRLTHLVEEVSLEVISEVCDLLPEECQDPPLMGVRTGFYIEEVTDIGVPYLSLSPFPSISCTCRPFVCTHASVSLWDTNLWRRRSLHGGYVREM